MPFRDMMRAFFKSPVMLTLIEQKISNGDYVRMIETHRQPFSGPENELLEEILQRFEFDVVQQQALAQAVMQQARLHPPPLAVGSALEDDSAHELKRTMLVHPFSCTAIPPWRQSCPPEPDNLSSDNCVVVQARKGRVQCYCRRRF